MRRSSRPSRKLLRARYTSGTVATMLKLPLTRTKMSIPGCIPNPYRTTPREAKTLQSALAVSDQDRRADRAAEALHAVREQCAQMQLRARADMENRAPLRVEPRAPDRQKIEPLQYVLLQLNLRPGLRRHGADRDGDGPAPLCCGKVQPRGDSQRRRSTRETVGRRDVHARVVGNEGK